MEIGSAVVGLGRRSHRVGQSDDADGPLRIHGVVLRGLTLIRHDPVAAVGGEDDRIGQRADRDRAEGDGLIARHIHEHQPARIGLLRRFDSDDGETVGADGDRVGHGAGRYRRPIGDGGPRSFDLRLAFGVRRVRRVDHIDDALLRVDDECAVCGGVVGDDLRGGFVERPRRMGPDRSDRERRVGRGMHDGFVDDDGGGCGGDDGEREERPGRGRCEHAMHGVLPDTSVGIEPAGG